MEEKGSISTRRRQLWGVFFTSIFAFIYLSISLAETSFSAFLPVQCKIWVLLMDFKFTYSKIKIRALIERIIVVYTYFLPNAGISLVNFSKTTRKDMFFVSI